MSDEHVIESIGRCRVLIRSGEVIEVSEPVISTCPLTKRFAYPVDTITPDAVRKNIENRMAEYGMCTPDREVFADDSFVGFGASELLGNAIKRSVIDAAVIACDGVGTVVVTDPGMVQGIGGRMSGLVSTTPIPEVIKRIEEGGGIVPDSVSATMDPCAGVKTAHDAGFSRVAVTVASADDAEKVRREDPGAIIVVVHTTGTTDTEAERLAEAADIITSCASKAIREVCGPKALMQAGSSIPVFAMTQKGKEVIIEQLRSLTHPIYVSHAPLPVRSEKEPKPLV